MRHEAVRPISPVSYTHLDVYKRQAETRELGIEASHVAYKGEQPALRDVAAGHVQFMLATNSSRPLIDAGKLVPIAVATEARVSALPGVPTFRELGLSLIHI